MTVSVIGGSQPVFSGSNVGNVQGCDADKDGGSAAASVGGGHHHHHHGGGTFMQDVTQALQGMGISLPGQSVNQASATNPAGSTGDQTAISSTATDPRQALHELMHDLRQALHQAGSQQATTAQTTAQTAASTDSNGDSDSSTVNPAAQGNGYTSFSTNLSSLITMLGSDANGTNSSGIGGKLQADLAALTQALGSSNTSGSSTDANAGTVTGTAATPDLLAFLKSLEANVDQSVGLQIGAGSVVAASA